jgi:hypothetical protein
MSAAPEGGPTNHAAARVAFIMNVCVTTISRAAHRGVPRGRKCPSKLAVLAVMAACVLPIRGWSAGGIDRDERAMVRVGPARAIATPAQAAAVAHDGDVVEFDDADYAGAASWPQSRIVLRGAGHGRPRMHANGTSAEGKGIWVIKGDDVVIENIAFEGARVPDRNGAGVRHEGGRLAVRDCLFERNEMGLLTWNDERGALIVERSEFRRNGVDGEHHRGDPIGHQIYVGRIASFVLRDSYVHQGLVGHLVKSRARENRIEYNRITDEDGRASYELEFPEGGMAVVLGNVIEQGARTENPDIVSYGAEGYRSAQNVLYLAHNTLVDRYAGFGGHFVRVWPGAARVVASNNLLVGQGSIDRASLPRAAGNFAATADAFVDAAGFDFRVRRHSRFAGAAVTVRPGPVDLQPSREIVHPLSSEPVSGGARTPGALQRIAP